MNIALAIILFSGYAFAGITPLPSDDKSLNSNLSELALEIGRNNLRNGGTVSQNLKISTSLYVSGQTNLAGETKFEGATYSRSTFTFQADVIGPQIIQAWVHFVGTGTVVIMDSVGVSSITDIGTGDYRINLSTPFARAEFLTLCSMGWTTPSIHLCFRNENEIDASSVRLSFINASTANPIDPDKASVAIMGRR